METFEDRYMDVLQNIEFAIIQVYRKHPQLTDFDALQAVNTLIRVYQAEAQGKAAPTIPPGKLTQEVYEGIRVMCEWRLGRAQLVTQNGQPFKEGPPPISLDEIIACLKRVRRSIENWNKRGGRQGYLTFVQDFIP